MSTGLTVMRIQPMHVGHQKIILQMLAQNDTAYVVVGSAQALDECNPFTYAERKSMIEAVFPEAVKAGRLVIIGVADIHNPPKWAVHVLSKVPQKIDTYYCGTGQDANLFAAHGVRICEINRAQLKVSATQVRQKMAMGDDTWHQEVPSQIHSIINTKIKGNKKMKRNEFSALYCDLYHLTMAQSMFDNNTHNKEEVYEMYIRQNPFGGSYLLTAGLGEVLQWLDDWHFTPQDIAYLKTQGFKDDFLTMLSTAKLTVDIDAFKEGEVVFPNEPILRVKGPAWQAVMIEAAILNIINAQSLIATKASRICRAAAADGHKRHILELGLRRAQDTQGFMSTRACFIGGVDATSNVEAARHYDIPVAGTMAHCFVMREESETEAFKKYLKSFPQKGSVLIDTYDTIKGVKKAIVASEETGISLHSVRLDSGDLSYLSKEVRAILDESGCTQTQIVASNDLDENSIQSLILEQKAPIDIFGVGTNLVTGGEQSALGGVYKLKRTGDRDVIKISELPIKTTISGATNVIRMIDKNGQYGGDVICDGKDNLIKGKQTNQAIISVNLTNEKCKVFEAGTDAYHPMIPVVRKGVVNAEHMNRSLRDIQESAFVNLGRLDETHKRLIAPHAYVAGIEKGLFKKRQEMCAARG